MDRIIDLSVRLSRLETDMQFLISRTEEIGGGVMTNGERISDNLKFCLEQDSLVFVAVKNLRERIEYLEAENYRLRQQQQK